MNIFKIIINIISNISFMILILLLAAVILESIFPNKIYTNGILLDKQTRLERTITNNDTIDVILIEDFTKISILVDNKDTMNIRCNENVFYSKDIGDSVYVYLNKGFITGITHKTGVIK